MPNGKAGQFAKQSVKLGFEMMEQRLTVPDEELRTSFG